MKHGLDLGGAAKPSGSVQTSYLVVLGSNLAAGDQL